MKPLTKTLSPAQAAPYWRPAPGGWHLVQRSVEPKVDGFDKPTTMVLASLTTGEKYTKVTVHEPDGTAQELPSRPDYFQAMQAVERHLCEAGRITLPVALAPTFNQPCHE